VVAIGFDCWVIWCCWLGCGRWLVLLLAGGYCWVGLVLGLWRAWVVVLCGVSGGVRGFWGWSRAPDTGFCMGVQARGRKSAYRNPFKIRGFLPCQIWEGCSRGVGVIIGVWLAVSGGIGGWNHSGRSLATPGAGDR